MSEPRLLSTNEVALVVPTSPSMIRRWQAWPVPSGEDRNGRPLGREHATPLLPQTWAIAESAQLQVFE